MHSGRDNIRTRLRRYFVRPSRRAVCPHCGFHLPRSHGWDGETRHCESCGRAIQPDTQQGMTNLVAWVYVILIMITMFGWVSGWWSVFLGLIPITMLTCGLIWAWPYMSTFHIASSGLLKRCPRCSYDLRATPDHCPECGLIVPEELRASEPAITPPPAAPSAEKSGRGR